MSVLDRTAQADLLFFHQPQPGNLVRVHQQDIPAPLQPTQPVAKPIDRRVELIIRSQGDQGHHTRPLRNFSKRRECCWRGELRLAAFGLPVSIPGWVAAIEAAWLEHPFIETSKIIRVGFGDKVAHQIVICSPIVPLQLRVSRQGGLGDTADDSQFGHAAFAGWIGLSERAIDVREGIFH